MTTYQHVSSVPSLPTPRRVKRTGSGGRMPTCAVHYGAGEGFCAAGTCDLYNGQLPFFLPVLWTKALVRLSQAVCCADIFRRMVCNQLQTASHPRGTRRPHEDFKRRSLMTATAPLLAAATSRFTSPDIVPLPTSVTNSGGHSNLSH